MHRSSAALILLVACASSPARFAISSEPALVADGVVSTAFSEVRLTASPDGRALLWGSRDRPGSGGGYDIWVSRRAGDAWGAPGPVPFNSAANEFDPAYTADGAWVYFFSNRPGGAGGDDLYRVAVQGDGFGPVEHLGELNTPGDEWGPAPSPDGTRLLFASPGEGGKQDLLVARIAAGGFGKPEPLPGAINTPDAHEFDATYLSDGKTIVFSRSRDLENDPVRLYVATLGPDGYDAGTALPASINVPGSTAYGPAIDWRERRVLYYTNRRADSTRQADIYRIDYRLE